MSDEDQGVDAQVALDKAAPEEKATRGEIEQRRAAKSLSKSNREHRSMKVKVYAPFHEYFNDRAFSISGENAVGPFDILPMHHDYISLLSPCDLTIRTINGEEQKITISGGIMHVKSDKVTVFLDV